ncbi:hypothetical protein D3C80_818100 [compost metagenome]
MIHRAKVVEGVFVLQRAAGQHLADTRLPDTAEGYAVVDVAVNPLMPGAATQGPVTDVPGRLGEQCSGVGFDVGAEGVALAGGGVDQAIDAVTITVLADLFVLQVGTPDQAAGGTADTWQAAFHRGAQTVHPGFAFGRNDAGVGAPVVREEAGLLLAPVAFHQQLLTEQVAVAVVEVHRLIVGEGLIAQLQAFDCHRLAILCARHITGVLFVFILLQSQGDTPLFIQVVAELGMQVMAFGVHVAALERFLGDALAVAVELVIALHQVGGQVPVQCVLASGHALEAFVGKTLVIEIVRAADTDTAAHCQCLPVVALGDDVDDAARGPGAIQAAGPRHHFDALDA